MNQIQVPQGKPQRRPQRCSQCRMEKCCKNSSGCPVNMMNEDLARKKPLYMLTGVVPEDRDYTGINWRTRHIQQYISINLDNPKLNCPNSLIARYIDRRTLFTAQCIARDNRRRLAEARATRRRDAVERELELAEARVEEIENQRSSVAARLRAIEEELMEIENRIDLTGEPRVIKDVLNAMGITITKTDTPCDPEECGICLETNCTVTTNCNHKYCVGCIKGIALHRLRVNCAYCRCKITELKTPDVISFE